MFVWGSQGAPLHKGETVSSCSFVDLKEEGLGVFSDPVYLCLSSSLRLSFLHFQAGCLVCTAQFSDVVRDGRHVQPLPCVCVAATLLIFRECWFMLHTLF